MTSQARSCTSSQPQKGRAARVRDRPLAARLCSVLRQLIIFGPGVSPDAHLPPNWHSSSRFVRPTALPDHVLLSGGEARVSSLRTRQRINKNLEANAGGHHETVQFHCFYYLFSDK